MGRLLVFLELAGVAVGIAFITAWGTVPAQVALLPLATALIVPCLAVVAAYPLRQAGRALRDGWGNNPFRVSASSSMGIWKFAQKIAVLSGVLGFLLFLVPAVGRDMTGKQASVAGLCGVEAAAILLILQAVRGTVESLARRDSTTARFDLSPEKLGEYAISAREREVAELLLAGLLYREIGQRLFISVKTVKTHVHRIYGKTGTRNRMELANQLRA